MKIIHEFTSSNVPLTDKPNGAAVGYISKHMNTHQTIECPSDLDEFVTMVTDDQYGYS